MNFVKTLNAMSMNYALQAQIDVGKKLINYRDIDGDASLTELERQRAQAQERERVERELANARHRALFGGRGTPKRIGVSPLRTSRLESQGSERERIERELANARRRELFGGRR
jgi:hypothetical protein